MIFSTFFCWLESIIGGDFWIPEQHPRRDFRDSAACAGFRLRQGLVSRRLFTDTPGLFSGKTESLGLGKTGVWLSFFVTGELSHFCIWSALVQGDLLPVRPGGRLPRAPYRRSAEFASRCSKARYWSPSGARWPTRDARG